MSIGNQDPITESPVQYTDFTFEEEIEDEEAMFEKQIKIDDFINEEQIEIENIVIIAEDQEKEVLKDEYLEGKIED